MSGCGKLIKCANQVKTHYVGLKPIFHSAIIEIRRRTNVAHNNRKYFWYNVSIEDEFYFVINYCTVI